MTTKNREHQAAVGEAIVRIDGFSALIFQRERWQFVANFDDLAIDPQIITMKKGTKSAPNEIDAITGATISSKAVVRIINESHAVWDKRLPRLGAEPRLAVEQPESEK